MNIDVCYVAETRQPEIKLPAVSGSSGHLVVERTSAETVTPPTWPGQLFEDDSLSYQEAIEQSAEATRERLAVQTKPPVIQLKAPAVAHRIWEIQVARHAVRERRKQEDLDWRRDKAAWRNTREARTTLSKAEFAAAQATWKQPRDATGRTRTLSPGESSLARQYCAALRRNTRKGVDCDRGSH